MTTKYSSLVDQLPKLSPLTMQMLRALAKPNCSVGELAEIASKDATLSARILRTANSASFGRLQPITSVRHAISIQGISLLRKFALGASISRLFSFSKGSDLFSMLRFNLHSVAVGTLLDVLAEELPLENADQALIAGMLHDVGELVIAVNCPKEYGQVLSLAAVTGESQVACERKVLGVDHAELSALAVLRWRLDDGLAHSIALHHEEEVKPGQNKLRLSTAIKRADEFVDALGISILAPGAGRLNPCTLDFEGFPGSEERIRTRFGEEWLKLSEMFE
jgi:HD-like signal output (HDOD) protein